MKKNNGRHETRRKEANERELLRASRTSAKQINFLDLRLGAGIGAVKERARLQKLI